MSLLTSPDRQLHLQPAVGNCVRDRRERKMGRGGKRQHVPVLINIRKKSKKVAAAAESFNELDPLASAHARYLFTVDAREHVEVDNFDDYKMYKWNILNKN